MRSIHASCKGTRLMITHQEASFTPARKRSSENNVSCPTLAALRAIKISLANPGPLLLRPLGDTTSKAPGTLPAIYILHPPRGMVTDEVSGLTQLVHSGFPLGAGPSQQVLTSS